MTMIVGNYFLKNIDFQSYWYFVKDPDIVKINVFKRSYISVCLVYKEKCSERRK